MRRSIAGGTWRQAGKTKRQNFTSPARDRGPEIAGYQRVRNKLSDEQANAFLACGKAMNYLMKMESHGSCGLEKASVYGAAVAIPQIARSAGWSRTLRGFAIRSYFFLLLNIGLQVFLLVVIAEDQHIMNAFSGKMHLCDFGAQLENCPNGKNCRGPGGTVYSAPRLYSFEIWATRVFIRDSLLSLFPERADQINESVDPGEYGIENYYCRLACSFLFMLSMMDDLYKTIALAQLLLNVPTGDGKWLRYEIHDWAPKEHMKRVHGWVEMDFVKFGVAGMPMVWKVMNAAFVFVPKLLIWWVLASLGMDFLLDTAGIVDGIMNSMALTFILNIDEMVFAVLTTVPVKLMMHKLEDFDLFDIAVDEDASDEVVLQEYIQNQLGHGMAFFKRLVPKRLITIAALMIFFVFKYYTLHCDETQDGSLVSKPLYLPTETAFQVWQLLVPLISKEEEHVWAMPAQEDR